MPERQLNLDRASRAVLRVGDGRGFVVAGADESYRYVITAAHCLPWLPPCMSFSKLEECSAYQGLLGRLDGAITVWAECAFVDPIGVSTHMAIYIKLQATYRCF